MNGRLFTLFMVVLCLAAVAHGFSTPTGGPYFGTAQIDAYGKATLGFVDGKQQYTLNVLLKRGGGMINAPATFRLYAQVSQIDCF